ncbi:MraY family glycosyltransferase [Ramlibacter sp. PS4R-6]|uniref:MraY family glycosyltransferase n=1 Tax=Ramlibacter sp. PS4R-6 TaxID=3133438 RepID=UPI0030AF7B15
MFQDIQIVMDSSWIALLGCTLGSFALAFTLARSPALGADLPGTGVQQCHVRPTSRLGGLGIFLALGVACIAIANREQQAILATILVAGAPALAIGLVEDLTRRVGVAARLASTIAAGAIAVLWSDTQLSSVHVAPLDALLSHAAIAALFTAFAVAGIANAMNIIDGCHGLAGGTATICLLGLATIAAQAGDFPLAFAAVAMAAAVGGFLIVNFPFGRVFLGDGGAYFTGFAIGWIAVLLPSRNPSVSPWASLLICAYPVIEVLYSVARRAARRVPAVAADRDHLHSIVARRIAPAWLPGARPDLHNAATSVAMWVLAGVPAVTAVIAWRHTGWLMMGTATAFMLYHCLYQRVVRHEQ